MKFNASHSKILDNLDNVDDAATAEKNQKHLDEIVQKIESHGGTVIEKTRFNVVAEMAEHRLHQLFNFVIDETQEFIGYVDAKLQDLQDHINHIEVCPPDNGGGS